MPLPPVPKEEKVSINMEERKKVLEKRLSQAGILKEEVDKSPPPPPPPPIVEAPEPPPPVVEPVVSVQKEPPVFIPPPPGNYVNFHIKCCEYKGYTA